MASTFGRTLTVSVFGQSHAPAIGCVVQGLPAGLALDTARLQAFLNRRAPGRTPWATPRKEADEPTFVSGLNQAGLTCGAPLAALIYNANTRSQDYAGFDVHPRPGHADFTAHTKWGAAADYNGGGHFSGRMTAPLCIAGGVCLQLLERAGVRVAAHLLAVAGEKDAPFAAGGIAPWDPAALEAQLEAVAAAPTFTTIEPAARERMQAAIEAANLEKDSVGGVVECVVCGLPAGVGAPMAAGVENALAANLFGIPAVKGVEFGAGFAAATMRGSAHNDAFTVNAAGAVTPATNTAGGILGGISTGAPVVFRVAIKPTASIALPQQSANYATASEERIVVHGRHDPCIAPRAVPVVEAVAAFTVADLILSEYPELLATPPTQKRIE